MRTLLASFLLKEAERDPNFYVFSGDHGYALFDSLRSNRPHQFINAGISEQAMVGYASGFAKSGMRCVVYGLAAFVPIRVLEFIKIDVCYDQLPIIFLGDGAGLVYNTLGATHQCAEDIAALRCLPYIRIYSPADKYELDACLENAIANQGPSYVRIGKSDKPNIHSGKIAVRLGELLPVSVSTGSIALVATGSMVSVAMSIATEHHCSVFSAPILTDLDAATVMSQLAPFTQIISLEEHSIHGGLGSILSEILTESPTTGKSLLRLGINGRFTQKCGSYDYAIREHKLNAESLLASIRQAGIHLPTF